MVEETTLKLESGLNDILKLVELRENVRAEVSTESVDNKENVFLLKEHTSRLNNEYGFREIDIAYETNRSPYQNAVVALESSENIFKRMWNWIVRMWEKLFGTEAKSDEKKAEEAVRKYTDKNDKILAWLEENKQYISEINTEGVESILRDKFAVSLILTATKKPSLNDIRKAAEASSKLFEGNNIGSIADYIDGKKAKDLSFTTNTSPTGVELNDSKVIKEPIGAKRNGRDVEAIEVIGYSRNAIYFLICQSTTDENKKKKLYFDTDAFGIKEEAVKDIELKDLRLSFEDLDAINDALVNQSETSFEKTKDLIDDITKFIDKSKDEDKQKNFSKRISKFLKELKGTHKKLVFAKAKNIEAMNSLLKDIKEKAKSVKEANAGKEADQADAQAELTKLDITDLY